MLTLSPLLRQLRRQTTLLGPEPLAPLLAVWVDMAGREVTDQELRVQVLEQVALVRVVCQAVRLRALRAVVRRMDLRAVDSALLHRASVDLQEVLLAPLAASPARVLGLSYRWFSLVKINLANL